MELLQTSSRGVCQKNLFFSLPLPPSLTTPSFLCSSLSSWHAAQPAISTGSPAQRGTVATLDHGMQTDSLPSHQSPNGFYNPCPPHPCFLIHGSAVLRLSPSKAQHKVPGNFSDLQNLRERAARESCCLVSAVHLSAEIYSSCHNKQLTSNVENVTAAPDFCPSLPQRLNPENTGTEPDSPRVHGSETLQFHHHLLTAAAESSSCT